VRRRRPRLAGAPPSRPMETPILLPGDAARLGSTDIIFLTLNNAHSGFMPLLVTFILEAAGVGVAVEC
jgi:hypothetical protein